MSVIGVPMAASVDRILVDECHSLGRRRRDGSDASYVVSFVD